VTNAISLDTQEQEVVLVASVPLTAEPREALSEGKALAARRGRVVARSSF
jgi:predicted glutamine amidotransferase